MSDSLEMLRRPSVRPSAPATPAPVEGDEDACPAFGYLRAARDRAVFVEFRFADGNRQAFPYSWLGPVRYDPSVGLVLWFVGDVVTRVRIEGTNLNAAVAGGVSLFDGGLLRHRVTWVREMPRGDPAPSGGVWVDRIRVLGPDDTDL
jgi:hypothetical protein